MKLKVLTIAITLASAASVFVAAAYNSAQMDAAQVPDKITETAIQLPEVAVIQVNKGNYKAEVIGHGEARARYQLTLTSEVSGQVEYLGKSFETGKHLQKGEQLVKLNDIDYQQAVASAQSAVADAQLALLEEQRQGKQASLEWQSSGIAGEPDSPLVLRQPQLAAAQAKLNNAQRQLTKAQRDLSKTRITAPFAALVVSRDVQPGSYLQVGNTIATLYSTDRMEIEIPLSNEQWLSLPSIADLHAHQWPVILTNIAGTVEWQGYVERVEQHLDSASRQRALMVVVDNPLTLDSPLFPGTFVEAKIQGRELEQLWQLPASAISQQGEVWYVDQTGELASFAAHKRFAQGNASYIAPMLGLESAQIVIRPLNSYVPGMRVMATLENSEVVKL
jgi:membrane fusion protein (multidrug efflux system)